ncbi:MAG: GatB/YqeY domain-containing protein [Bacteroidota bacterium]|nr:GatB/YqeY domain-containing protein [Bacteroidota bacterium]
MSLAILINEDIKAAMLARDARKLEALRAIKASLLLAKTGKDMSSGEIPEDVELSILQKLVKQRKESAEIYREQNRPELAETEEFQADIIGQYLPEQLSEEDLQDIIKKIIKDTGASDMKDMGKVMGMATKQLAGKADNKKISVIVRQLLNP